LEHGIFRLTPIAPSHQWLKAARNRRVAARGRWDYVFAAGKNMDTGAAGGGGEGGARFPCARRQVPGQQRWWTPDAL